MSIFINNYQRLRDENNNEIAKLSGKNWDPLKRMMDYTSSFDVSLFELEVIKKDLIGIAREADAQNEDLTEKIGMPEKEFCNSLIKGGMKHIFGERVLLGVWYAVVLLLLFYIVGFIFGGFPINYGLRFWDVLFAFLCGACDSFLYHFIIARSTYMAEKKRKGTVFASYALWLVLVIPLMISNSVDFFIIRGNGWVILGGLALLAAIVNYANKYYWDKCSEKYNWQ